MSLNVRSSQVALVAFALACARVASAAPDAPPSTPITTPANAEAMADARFKAGLAAYDRGDYDAARLEFLQAQAIYPRPSLMRNLALSEMHTSRPLDALAHLRIFIADAGTAPDKRALAMRTLDEAYAQTAHLSITAPEGSHLKVDGKDAGVAPLKDPVDVVVGLHGVDADMKGVRTHYSVQAAGGKLTEVAFLAPVVGEAHVVAMPGPTGPTSAPPGEPSSGGHYWNGRRTAGVVITGVGVVGLVVGAVFGAERAGQTSDAATALASAKSAGAPGVPASKVCSSPQAAGVGPCTSLTNALNANGTDAQIEESLLVAGGLLIAIGVVTTLWPGQSEAPTAGFAPWTGPHLGGLSWSGRF